MPWLHLQEPGQPLKCFKTWRACASYIYENQLSNYWVGEEGAKTNIVKSYTVQDGKRYLIIDPENYPPASVLPML